MLIYFNGLMVTPYVLKLVVRSCHYMVDADSLKNVIQSLLFYFMFEYDHCYLFLLINLWNKLEEEGNK